MVTILVKSDISIFIVYDALVRHISNIQREFECQL